jgi:hypothetical protein
MAMQHQPSSIKKKSSSKKKQWSIERNSRKQLQQGLKRHLDATLIGAMVSCRAKIAATANECKGTRKTQTDMPVMIGPGKTRINIKIERKAGTMRKTHTPLTDVHMLPPLGETTGAKYT